MRDTARRSRYVTWVLGGLGLAPLMLLTIAYLSNAYVLLGLALAVVFNVALVVLTIWFPSWFVRLRRPSTWLFALMFAVTINGPLALAALIFRMFPEVLPAFVGVTAAGAVFVAWSRFCTPLELVRSGHPDRELAIGWIRSTSPPGTTVLDGRLLWITIAVVIQFVAAVAATTLLLGRPWLVFPIVAMNVIAIVVAHRLGRQRNAWVLIAAGTVEMAILVAAALLLR